MYTPASHPPSPPPCSNVLRQYKPAQWVDAQVAARAAAKERGSPPDPTPLRVLRLDRLAQEVQVQLAWVAGRFLGC